MSITEIKNAFVDPTAGIAMSQIFTVTAGTGNPTYLVVSLLDRNEYTRPATGATGLLSGNGHTLSLSGVGGDARGAGIVFTYQTASGRYYNSTYGYFDQLTYTASASLGDVTNLSVFGTNNLSLATADAANAYALMQADAGGYLGSATVVTQPKFSGAVPAQATPNLIASVATSFVGQAWNENGCWVLASTIAAEAGASLPVQSTAIGVPGQANGEWIVAFNGPAGQSANWQSLVKAGEIIVIGTAGGGGHITTCVSGSGSTAMLVDNATFIGANGAVQNSANDGSSSDILIQPAHAASQEWSGVSGSTVVIYELDTPVVSASFASAQVGFHATEALGSVFIASDPAGRSITQWQVYDTSNGDTLLSAGVTYNDHSAASALSVASLSGVSLVTGVTAGGDTVEARAFNGTYWGDWQAWNVSVAAPAPASPPVVSQQTPNQTWTEGTSFSLALPANTFTDPRGLKLTYTATQANGQALPSWLTFNQANETFSGTAPSTAQSLSIKVTATDTGGLSASETFGAAVQAPPPKPGITVTSPTPTQTWTDGLPISLVLPARTFTDALGLSMSFLAYETSGPNVTSWLRFNAATDTFSGSVPSNASGTIGLEVIARDAVGMTAADMFSVTFAPAAGHMTAAIGPGALTSIHQPSGPPLFGLLGLQS